MLARYMLSSYVRLSVRLSVYLSVTCRYCTKTAKRRITQATLYDSNTIAHDMDSSLMMPKISAKFQRGHPNGVTPKGDAKYRWGRFKSSIFDLCIAISQHEAALPQRHCVMRYVSKLPFVFVNLSAWHKICRVYT